MRGLFRRVLLAGILLAGCRAVLALPNSTSALKAPANPPLAAVEAYQETGPGLQVDYYHGTQFNRKVLSRTEQQIDYKWANQTALPGIDELNFSARWTGRLYAPADGVYTLIMQVDDGIRLWLGGKLLVDEWHSQSVIMYTRKVRLKAGHHYPLKIEYFNHHGPGMMKLLWELPQEPDSPLLSLGKSPARTVIPAKFLSGPVQKPVAVAKPKAPVPVSLPKPEPVRAGVAVVRREPKPAKPAVVKPTPPVVDADSAPPLGNTRPAETLAGPEAVPVPRQVHFEQSQYVLLPHSYTELDQLADLLLEHPGWQVEIAGHTDNVGDPRLNLALSENRALVVANYLVRQGVAEGRIKARGYGSTRPLADNQTETERARNRRVEFVVEK